MNQQSQMSAIILAGGKSERMKENKALLPVQGLPLIQKIAQDLETYFQEIIISSQTPTVFDFLPYRVVLDKHPGQGPLMGILCGLEASAYSLNFIIACDIPEIDFPFLQQMMSYLDDYEIVVPVSGKDKFEPLFAFYNKALIPRIQYLLNQGVRQIIQLFSLAQVKYIPLQSAAWFYNLNYTADYHRYLEKISRHEKEK